MSQKKQSSHSHQHSAASEIGQIEMKRDHARTRELVDAALGFLAEKGIVNAEELMSHIQERFNSTFDLKGEVVINAYNVTPANAG